MGEIVKASVPNGRNNEDFVFSTGKGQPPTLIAVVGDFARTEYTGVDRLACSYLESAVQKIEVEKLNPPQLLLQLATLFNNYLLEVKEAMKFRFQCCLVFAAVKENRLFYLPVGDCRAAVCRDGLMFPLHGSLWIDEKGNSTPPVIEKKMRFQRAGENPPDAALGVEPIMFQMGNVKEFELQPEDVIVLYSDGVDKFISPTRLLELVESQTADPNWCSSNLADRVLNEVADAHGDDDRSFLAIFGPHNSAGNETFRQIADLKAESATDLKSLENKLVKMHQDSENNNNAALHNAAHQLTDVIQTVKGIRSEQNQQKDSTRQDYKAIFSQLEKQENNLLKLFENLQNNNALGNSIKELKTEIQNLKRHNSFADQLTNQIQNLDRRLEDETKSIKTFKDDFQAQFTNFRDELLNKIESQSVQSVSQIESETVQQASSVESKTKDTQPLEQMPVLSQPPTDALKETQSAPIQFANDALEEPTRNDKRNFVIRELTASDTVPGEVIIKGNKDRKIRLSNKLPDKSDYDKTGFGAPNARTGETTAYYLFQLNKNKNHVCSDLVSEQFIKEFVGLKLSDEEIIASQDNYFKKFIENPPSTPAERNEAEKEEIKFATNFYSTRLAPDKVRASFKSWLKSFTGISNIFNSPIKRALGIAVSVTILILIVIVIWIFSSSSSKTSNVNQANDSTAAAPTQKSWSIVVHEDKTSISYVNDSNQERRTSANRLKNGEAGRKSELQSIRAQSVEQLEDILKNQYGNSIILQGDFSDLKSDAYEYIKVTEEDLKNSIDDQRCQNIIDRVKLTVEVSDFKKQNNPLDCQKLQPNDLLVILKQWKRTRQN